MLVSADQMVWCFGSCPRGWDVGGQGSTERSGRQDAPPIPTLSSPKGV